MQRPFHLMAEPTGFQRNIACEDCFYLEKGEAVLKPAAAQRHMDDATLKACVRASIAASPAPQERDQRRPAPGGADDPHRFSTADDPRRK